ncbi:MULTISPECIES: TetR/AcrR family transcriptional regulator [Aeromicrobium]|jgi:AcrR family transcriptional regulator|uniref:TetR family transcriptional regulator n=1 Tax=Aeromicrobium erythreum TaxID=2041 RepID=A0A0U4BET9_9ACTN|nr:MULTISPECIES: TetR/AcrR family transcriptional regulator [Aeromicrobium]ALX06148.1 TetR family transcriptional regulator [Aeromicrobium erythreum]
MSTRRREIARSAVELFADRGFHGVSVGDVGAASGISGPAIYKHFRGKEEVLAQALVDISTELLDTGRARVAAHDDASDRLDALVDWHIDFAVSHPAYIVVQEREWSRLDADARAEVRTLQLAYVDLWVDVVRSLRDDLQRAEARAVVQAVFGLLNSTPHSARIGEDALRTLLARMARAALLA